MSLLVSKPVLEFMLERRPTVTQGLIDAGIVRTYVDLWSPLLVDEDTLARAEAISRSSYNYESMLLVDLADWHDL